MQAAGSLAVPVMEAAVVLLVSRAGLLAPRLRLLAVRLMWLRRIMALRVEFWLWVCLAWVWSLV